MKGKQECQKKTPEVLEALSSQEYELNNEVDCAKGGRWTLEEDECLRQAVDLFGERKWKQIATKVLGRTPLQCLHRWTKILRPGLIKGTWSPMENELLREWVRVNGPNRWSDCSHVITGRSGKQCREHWFNKLNPDLKKGNWTSEEDEMIFKLYQQFGTSWTKIEKYLPGRTENAIKNRFYSTLRRVQPQNGGKKVKKEEMIASNSQDTNSEEPVLPTNPKLADFQGQYKIWEANTQKATPKLLFETQMTESLAKIPQIKNINLKNTLPEKITIPKEYNEEFEEYLMKVECGSLPVEANSSTEGSLDSLEYKYKKTQTRRNNSDLESVQGFEENSVRASSQKGHSTDLSSPVTSRNFGSPYEVFSCPQEQNFLNFNPLQFMKVDPISPSIQDLFNHPLISSNMTPIFEPKSVLAEELPFDMFSQSTGEEQKIFLILNQLKKLEVMLQATKNELKSRYNELRYELASQADLNMPFFDPMY